MSLDLTSNDPQFIFIMDKQCEGTVYAFSGFRLDADHLMLYRGAEEVSLPPKAIETLLALVEKPSAIVSKTELLNTIWKETTVEEQNLAQYVHLLRKALGTRPNGKPFIETLKRRGYRFNGEVSKVHDIPTISSDPSALHSLRKLETSSIRTAHAAAVTRVKRNGNVLAVADWRRSEQPSEESYAQVVAPYTEDNKARSWINSHRYAVAFVALVVLSVPVFYFLRSGSFARPLEKFHDDLTYLRLTDGIEVEDAAISPDGKYFVYHEQDGSTAHLWLQQTGQSNRVEIAQPAERKIFGKTFSPDGSFIYFIAQERPNEPNELFRVPTLGGVQEKILTDISAPVSFSPDGKEFAFLRWNGETGESSLMKADLNGGNETVLSKRIWPEQLSGGVAWSPNGSQIAVGLTIRPPASGNPFCSISTVDRQTGATDAISLEKWDTCYRMVWTRDGQGLVFVGTKLGEGYSTRRDQVYYISTSGGGSHRITTDGSRHQPDSLSITDDDQLLVVPFNRASQIWTSDPNGDSRSTIQLTTGLADGRAGIAPLADGRIGYVSRTGENFGIWIMSPDGSDRRQLTSDPQIVEELRAAPNGRYFVFSARPGGRSHLFRMEADGTNIKQLTDGDNHEIDSAISPDSNWVVYTSCGADGDFKNVSIRKVSIQGGEPVQIAHVDAEAPRFSPDGNFISFATSDDKIGIIPSNGESPVKIFEPIQTPFLNGGAQWTPDGRALIYIVRQKDVGNLWSQPLDGTPARPLTDFTSGDIYNFAFSNDGSRLYLARGYQIRDAFIVRNFH